MIRSLQPAIEKKKGRRKEETSPETAESRASAQSERFYREIEKETSNCSEGDEKGKQTQALSPNDHQEAEAATETRNDAETEAAFEICKACCS